MLNERNTVEQGRAGESLKSFILCYALYRSLYLILITQQLRKRFVSDCVDGGKILYCDSDSPESPAKKKRENQDFFGYQNEIALIMTPTHNANGISINCKYFTTKIPESHHRHSHGKIQGNYLQFLREKV